MSTQKNDKQIFLTALIIAVTLLGIGTTGCATEAVAGGRDGAEVIQPTGAAYKTSRRVAGAGQAILVYANSVHVDPVIRPVSHAATLASLILKSTDGMLRRVTIGTVRMPALRGPIPEVGNNAPMNLTTWERRLDKVTHTRQSRGTIEFLVDGEEYFSRMTQAIDDANESIDIRTYIFDNDDYAASVADHLKKRSEDVRVRVMFDGLGSMQAMQIDPETMPRDYRPALSMAMYLERGSSVRVRTTSNPWLTSDHTKTTIIDRKIAFVGGMNIGREYRYDWHDLMFEVRGPVVDQLQHESDKAWARAGIFGDLANVLTFIKGNSKDAEDLGYPVRVLQTRNFDSDIYKAQVAAIRNAQSYILIENAYFSDDLILYELARARRRGVDVRVILPGAGNHGPLNASNLVAINQMLEHGIRVYRYPGMSHVKAAIFDGWVCVGSANFDKLSLKVNKELNLATSDQTVANALLERVFIPDLMISEEIIDPVEVTMTARLAEIIVDELL